MQRVHFEEQDFSILSFDRVLVWCFRSDATAARMARVLPVHRDLARRYPQGFAVMTIIGQHVPLLMDSAARQQANSITAEFSKNYCALGDVVEGSGLRSSTARSVITGVRMFGRTECPAKVFSDISASAEWLSSFTHCDPKGLLETAIRARTAPISLAAPSSSA